MPNRLSNATSPYLLQHADNPVDWYEWSEEAINRAKEEDKPIFLSVGYSACHWCHVMAHESFEDQGTADLMNQFYVNIKVDREERPDIDAIYMDAVVAMTGQGGWPMSVFLTPEGEPFYGGTYFPPVERFGMPSFKRVLTSVHDAWHNRRQRLDEAAAELTDRLRQSAQLQPDQHPLTTELLDAAFAGVYQVYDDVNGGFGSQPKFPQAMVLEYLLRHHVRTGQPAALAMVTHTLKQMARGGIYDQLGGGFHRYATDAYWLVPHFEKMLYDNALLARIYLYAWQRTGEEFYRQIVEETCDYVLREMKDPGGGFYSTQDADSEGEEGKFFTWRPAEVKALLGDRDGNLFCRFYDVTETGNFEGKNILHVSQDFESFALTHGIALPDLKAVIERSRQRLFQQREKRVKPHRDEKILAAWNGLMMQTLAEAGAAFEREDYIEAAIANAEFLLSEMSNPQGRLWRSWKDGTAKIPGYLEDHAIVAQGLIALFQSTNSPRWLQQAERLLQVVEDHFWDDVHGAAFQTADDHESLIVRRKDFFDNAEPSGNSAYAMAALRLARLTDQTIYLDRILSIFRIMRHGMSAQPTGFGHLLSALDLYLRPSREIVIVGDRRDARTQELLRVAYQSYLPDSVIAGLHPEDESPLLPLLANRTMVDGMPTAYVCRGMICKLPVTDPADLVEQLRDHDT